MWTWLMPLLGCRVSLEQTFGAVDRNDPTVLRRWLEQGGDPDATLGGRSLLYVATGPHGGAEVLDLLLAHGADPELGADGYSPLMNAASWCWLDGVKKLVDAGADPRPGLVTVCEGPGAEPIVVYLKAQIDP
jgi:hypothetical protein